MALLEVPAAACAQDVGRARRTVRVGDLVYRARVRVVVDSVAVVGHGPLPREQVQAAVIVTNVGRRPVALGRWPNCFFTTLELWPTVVAGRAARAGARRRTATWDEERWRVAYERATGIIVECDFAGALPDRELAPGASLTVEHHASSPLVRDVLGDSLTTGRYRVVLRVRPHTAAHDAAPSLSLAAGEVVLRAGRRRHAVGNPPGVSQGPTSVPNSNSLRGRLR